MAIFGYDVTELVASVKARCLVPLSQQTYSEEDILRFANEEMELKLIPNIIRVKEEFYVDSIKYPLSGSNKRFEIPYRAIGAKLRNVQYEANSATYPMTRIQPEEVPYYEYGSTAGTQNAFYLENNFVVIPTQYAQGTGQIKLSYYFKPNKLVEIERVGVISSIDRVGDGTIGSVTLSNITFPQNLTPGTLVDFLQVKPNFRTYSYDISIQTVNPTTNQVFINLTDIPESLQIGDHIATAGECIIPQMPVELHPMLAQAVACRILEAQGDVNNLKAANAKLTEMESNLFTLIDQRTEGNPQKINNQNGIIARSKINYRRFGGGYRP